MQEPVLDLLPSELGGEVELVQIALEQLVDGIDILRFHLPKTLGGGLIRQGVFANLESGLAVGRAGTEANLIQLLPVDGSVVVPASADRLR